MNTEVRLIDRNIVREFANYSNDELIHSESFGIYLEDELHGVASLGKTKNTTNGFVILDKFLCIDELKNELFEEVIDWCKENQFNALVFNVFNDNESELAKYLNFKFDGKYTNFGRWVYKVNDSFVTKNEKLSALTSQKHSKGYFKGSHISSYFKSEKSGKILHCQSSYELRCMFLLEQDEKVLSFERCHNININGRSRNPDLLVTYVDRKEIIEIKPIARVLEDAVALQILDTKDYCEKENYLFKLWTEEDSGLKNVREISAWAREYLVSVGLLSQEDFEEIRERRKQTEREYSKIYYWSQIINDIVLLKCNGYCGEDKSILNVTHKQWLRSNPGKNVETDYWCHACNGRRTGLLPKEKSIYRGSVIDEQKRCSNCGDVLPISSFTINEVKNGVKIYRADCNDCRNKKNREKTVNKSSDDDKRTIKRIAREKAKLNPDGTKTCSNEKCRINLPPDKFPVKDKRKDGSILYRDNCPKCYAEEQKLNREKRKASN